MKSFNLHDIMNTAWKIRKAAKVSMSEALKKAWRIAKAMVLGARVWEKGSKSRLYLNEAGKAIIGLTYCTYNSGNIRCAELNGEEISNAECGRVINALYGAYLDLADWTIHTGLSKSAASVNESLTSAFAL